MRVVNENISLIKEINALRRENQGHEASLPPGPPPQSSSRQEDEEDVLAGPREAEASDSERTETDAGVDDRDFWPHDEEELLAKLKAAGADDEKYQSLLDGAAVAEEIDAVFGGVGWGRDLLRSRPRCCGPGRLPRQKNNAVNSVPRGGPGLPPAHPRGTQNGRARRWRRRG